MNFSKSQSQIKFCAFIPTSNKKNVAVIVLLVASRKQEVLLILLLAAAVQTVIVMFYHSFVGLRRCFVAVHRLTRKAPITTAADGIQK